MVALEAPRGGVIQRRAARDGLSLLPDALNGFAKCLFALAKITAQRKIVQHALH